MEFLDQDFCTVSLKDLTVGYMQEHIISKGYEIVAAVPVEFNTAGGKMLLERVMLFFKQKGDRKK